MLEIRRASEADVDALVPLKASVHALHVAHRPDFFQAMASEQLAGWLRDRLAEPTTRVWMAEDEGKPVGYVLAARRERDATSFRHARAWCEIDEVAVDVSRRGSGIARALIERAVAQAAEWGLDAVELSTWAFNEPARAAFEHVGFQAMLVRYELSAPRQTVSCE